MLKILFLGLLFTAFGCSSTPEKSPEVLENQEYYPLVNIPSWDATQNITSIYDPAAISELFFVFLNEWDRRKFPGSVQDIGDLFDRIELHWQPYKFKADCFPQYEALWGLTLISKGGEEITVYVYDWRDRDPNLGKTSLTHELIHIALYATTGNVRADHFGNGSTFTPELESLKKDINDLFE